MVPCKNVTFCIDHMHTVGGVCKHWIIYKFDYTVIYFYLQLQNLSLIQWLKYLFLPPAGPAPSVETLVQTTDSSIVVTSSVPPVKSGSAEGPLRNGFHVTTQEGGEFWQKVRYSTPD